MPGGADALVVGGWYFSINSILTAFDVATGAVTVKMHLFYAHSWVLVCFNLLIDVLINFVPSQV
jgi:hypothetical protein